MNEPEERGFSEFLTIGDVARRSGFDTTAVMSCIYQDLLKGVRSEEGEYRVHKDELERFMKKFNLPLQIGKPSRD